MSSRVVPIGHELSLPRALENYSPEQTWPRDEPVDCDRGGERAVSMWFQTLTLLTRVQLPLGAQYVLWVK